MVFFPCFCVCCGGSAARTNSSRDFTSFDRANLPAGGVQTEGHPAGWLRLPAYPRLFRSGQSLSGKEHEPKGARRLVLASSLNSASAARSRHPVGMSPKGGRRRAAEAELDPFSGCLGHWMPFAFACHLQDYRVMDKSVDRRRGCHWIFEDTVPFTENQIAGYD